MGSLKQWTSFVLREKKTLVFVINNSLNSRMQYAKKFHSLWVSVHEVCNGATPTSGWCSCGWNRSAHQLLQASWDVRLINRSGLVQVVWLLPHAVQQREGLLQLEMLKSQKHNNWSSFHTDIITDIISYLYSHRRLFLIGTSIMCMVGDKQDADILYGQNAGCRTLLVLSDRLISLVFEFPLTLK
ncbi:hypothetical protein NC651_014779 [Populus alba x Populus x berolinensis]|nr:hypothetical protein NC651_014779 [Populus alba x Populus x berolinensis]